MDDITTRKDIKNLVDTFYEKVKQDVLIGHFFNKVVVLTWDIHMPIMYNFWESVLLTKPVYKGNPMLKHIALDKKEKLLPEHFDQWLKLWKETVDTLYKGEKAELAKERAEMIAKLMQHKIKNARDEYALNKFAQDTKK